MSTCGALQSVFPSQSRSACPEHISQYQAMLFSKLKFSPNTETPYPRMVIHLPEILSREEVAPDRCSRASVLSHPSDDALWDRSTPCGGVTPEGRRYRQPPDGGSHSRRQGQP